MVPQDHQQRQFLGEGQAIFEKILDALKALILFFMGYATKQQSGKIEDLTDEKKAAEVDAAVAAMPDNAVSVHLASEWGRVPLDQANSHRSHS